CPAILIASSRDLTPLLLSATFEQHPAMSIPARHRYTFAIEDRTQNCLACAAQSSDECRDRGQHRERSMPTMTEFTTDSDNNITAHATAEEATSVSGAD